MDVLFKANSQNAKISGEVILAYLDAAGEQKENLLRQLKAGGLTDIQASAWYPMQIYLNALKVFAGSLGSEALKKLGEMASSDDPLPDTIKDVAEALKSMDAYYKKYHKDAGSGWIFQKTSNNSCRLISETPYPDALEEGLLTGLMKRFNVNLALIIDSASKSKDKGGSATTYFINW